MNKLVKFYRIIRSKSIRYVLFRSKYELERKTGLLARKYPTVLTKTRIPSLTEWRTRGCGWFFDDRSDLTFEKNKTVQLKEKMEHILKGDVLFFSKQWKSLGLDYDWVTNPETGYHYDAKQHWTKVNDFSKEAGDIKFVWEKSRFSWLLTVCRYDYHYDEDQSTKMASSSGFSCLLTHEPPKVMCTSLLSSDLINCSSPTSTSTPLTSASLWCQ